MSFALAACALAANVQRAGAQVMPRRSNKEAFLARYPSADHRNPTKSSRRIRKSPSKPCSAKASARGQMLSGRVEVEFSVRVLEPLEFSTSTGTLRFGLRVKDSAGNERVLDNYTARWQAREGKNFRFAAVPIALRSDVATSLSEVVDVKVLECSSESK
jgi:hypothetical protein